MYKCMYVCCVCDCSTSRIVHYCTARRLLSECDSIKSTALLYLRSREEKAVMNVCMYVCMYV
jgi:hypothetical protein